MIITMNENGTIINTVPERIYQGSNKANTFAVVSTIARTNQMLIAFKLPQVGTYTEPALMTLAENIDTETGFNVWTYDIPSTITEYYGTVEYQVQCITPDSTTIASGAGSFVVERGVPPVLPEEPTPTIYEQILQNIGSIQADILNLQTDIEKNATDISNLQQNAMLKADYPNVSGYEQYNSTTEDAELDGKRTGEVITDVTGNTTRYNNRYIHDDRTDTFDGSTFRVYDRQVDGSAVTIPNDLTFDFGLDGNTPIARLRFNQNNQIVKDVDLLSLISDTSNFVTLDTAQTITGAKTFNNIVSINIPANLLRYLVNADGIQLLDQNSNILWAVGSNSIQTNDSIEYSANYQGKIQTDSGTITKQYNWNDVQIYLDGDTISSSIQSLNSGLGIPRFRENMLVSCIKNQFNNTYLAGHVYLCIKEESNTYTMSDITSQLLNGYATESFVNNAISGITTFTIQIVQELPQTGQANIMYLVPNSSGSGTNYYDEYLWVDKGSGTFGFEQIGTTQIDLSNYYTKDELDGKVIPQDSSSSFITSQNSTILKLNNSIAEMQLAASQILLRTPALAPIGQIYVVNNNQLAYFNNKTGINLVKYSLDDVQTQITGNALENNLTVTGSLNIGKAYLCNATSTSGTYQQGHIYLIGGSSGAYIATDITPTSSGGIQSQTTTFGNLYNVLNEITETHKILYMEYTPTNAFNLMVRHTSISESDATVSTETIGMLINGSNYKIELEYYGVALGYMFSIKSMINGRTYNIYFNVTQNRDIYAKCNSIASVNNNVEVTVSVNTNITSFIINENVTIYYM